MGARSVFSPFSRQAHVGEDLFSEEQKVKIRKRQQVAVSEYKVALLSHVTCNATLMSKCVYVGMRAVKIQYVLGNV